MYQSSSLKHLYISIYSLFDFIGKTFHRKMKNLKIDLKKKTILICGKKVKDILNTLIRLVEGYLAKGGTEFSAQ